MDKPEQKIALPWNPNRQHACLGHMIHNKEFFIQCKDKIKPNWFIERYDTKIYDVMLKFFEQYKRHPSVDEIQNHTEYLLEDNKVRVKLAGRIAESSEASTKHGLDVIRNELTEWLSSVTFQSEVERSADLFNSKKYKEAYLQIQELTTKLRDISFEDGKAVDFTNYGEYLKDSEKVYENAYTTGLSVLDRALIEEGKGGGLVPGDMTVILAPVNLGKTACAITIIKHNIERGKNILFLTHEGTPTDIRQKVLCSVLGVTRAGLFDLYRSQEGLKVIEMAVQKINKFLTYIPYNKPGMNIEDVAPIIVRHAETLRSKGEKLDLLVDDYPAKLGTVKNSRGASPQRITDSIVYNYFTQLCLDLNCHGIVAAQTNREGSKINKGKENRLLKIEDVAESWGICQTATNVITLNRNPEGQFSHILTFYVAKSRSSKVGMAVAAKADFAKCITHSDDLGAIYYMGDVPVADKADMFLESHKNSEIPPSAIFVKDDNNGH